MIKAISDATKLIPTPIDEIAIENAIGINIIVINICKTSIFFLDLI